MIFNYVEGLSLAKKVVFLKGESLTLTQTVLQFNFKGALSGLRQCLATESPLKMMKNAFYFTSEALSFSRCLSFSVDFLVMY